MLLLLVYISWLEEASLPSRGWTDPHDEPCISLQWDFVMGFPMRRELVRGHLGVHHLLETKRSEKRSEHQPSTGEWKNKEDESGQN